MMHICHSHTEGAHMQVNIDYIVILTLILYFYFLNFFTIIYLTHSLCTPFLPLHPYTGNPSCVVYFMYFPTHEHILMMQQP